MPTSNQPPSVASTEGTHNPHFAAIGGESGIARLVDSFYAQMDARPAARTIRAMHPADLSSVKGVLRRYLTEWMGGPAEYSTQRGHPRLRRRHLRFSIGPGEVSEWLACMRAALDETVDDACLREQLFAAFTKTAEFMRNDQAHRHEHHAEVAQPDVVVFYEKPGCINNTKQKNWLLQAGQQLEARNLLTHPWQMEELLCFLSPLPVSEWFNRAAPAVKDGRVEPERLSREEAIKLLLEQPLLIRRPLIEYRGRRQVGFDVGKVAEWIGLPAAVTERYSQTDLESCPKER